MRLQHAVDPLHHVIGPGVVRGGGGVLEAVPLGLIDLDTVLEAFIHIL